MNWVNLGPYCSKSIWSRSIFPCVDLSEVVYIIWTLKTVNDLKPANEMAFSVLAASFTFGRHLNYWTIYTWMNSSKTQLFEICIGQLLTFCNNAFTWFFRKWLVNKNERQTATRKHVEKLLIFVDHIILLRKCCPLQSFSLLGWFVGDCLYHVQPVTLSSGF